MHAPQDRRSSLGGWAVALVASVPALAVQATSEPPEDVQREWLVRAWALFPERSERAIAEALASEDWHERLLALEALARSPGAVRLARERWGDAVDAALLDPRPNIRTAALELRTLIAPGRPLEPETLAALAADPWPECAEALAVHLGRVQAASDEPRAATDTLLGLAGGGDPLLARRARLELLGAGVGAWHAQRDWIAADASGRRLVRAFTALTRAGAPPPLIAGLREAFGERVGLAALVEALAWRSGQPFDRRRLAAGWASASIRSAELDPSLAHELRVELARTSRLGDPELGGLLLERAGELASGRSGALLDREEGLAPDERAEAAALLVEAGAHALLPAAAVEHARALPADLAGAAWRHVAPRAQSWDADSVSAWLTPEVPRELREEVARSVHDAFDRTRDAGSEAILGQFLHDPDTSLRRLAFRWLCAAEGIARRLEGLRVAWLACGPEERLERLRWLPRSTAPAPFREDLIALAEQSATRTPSVLELLALFEGDAELGRQVEGWLDEELRGLAAATELASFQADEWRAKGLVRTLGRLASPGAEDAIAAALARSIAVGPAPTAGGEHDAEVPKTCAYWLGRSEAGRRALERALERPVPSRVRIEATLALALDVQHAARAGRAIVMLLDDWGGCDAELRGRILNACGGSADPQAGRFLEQVARDPAAALSERVAAVSALARRRDVAAIERALNACEDQLRDWDVLRACLHALAGLGSEGARSVLRAWVEGAAARGPAGEEAAQLARDGLAALAAAGPLPPELAARALDWPRRAASADLTARFAERRLPAVEFRWRSELELGAYSSRHSALGAVLAACHGWWEMDGRLLLALGQAARGAGEREAARELLRGAWVGLLGEPPSRERDKLLGTALLDLFVIAGEEHDWEAFVFWCDKWLAVERSGDGTFRVFERHAGSFDPHEEVDPHARLVSARAQALAWAALERGDAELAAVLARRAALHARGSSAARAAQEALEEALARAR